MNDRPTPVPQPQPQMQPQPGMIAASEVQAILNELTWQRNMMGDRAANLAVQMGVVQKELTDTQERVKQITAEAAGAHERVRQLEAEVAALNSKLVEPKPAETAEPAVH